MLHHRQKIVHPNKTAARKKIRWQRSQPDCIDGDYLQPYRCGDHWHIGHGWKKA